MKIKSYCGGCNAQLIFFFQWRMYFSVTVETVLHFLNLYSTEFLVDVVSIVLIHFVTPLQEILHALARYMFSFHKEVSTCTILFFLGFFTPVQIE